MSESDQPIVPIAPAALPNGVELIATERERQLTQKGWGIEHDDGHIHGELIDAGLSYVYAAINVGHPAMGKPPAEWPWTANYWRPSANPIRNLAKAGALIAAEIDRLQRASEKVKPCQET